MKTLAVRTSLSAALALPLLLSACGGGGGDAASSSPPTAHNSLGLMQLTVSGIGSSSVTAHAALFHAGPQAAAAGLSNDAASGLDVEQVSAGTIDVGTRGAGGTRYITVVYKVRNAQFCGTPGTCTPYTTAGQNLSFVAANTAGNLANTGVTGIYREDGTTDSTEQALATQMLPTDGMQPSNPAGGVILADGQASLQVFNESEITGAFVDPTVSYLFPYGYVVENVNTPNSRTLPASPANNQWDGQLTFAFKVPLQASAKDDPYSVSFIFDVLDDTNTRVSESAEAQNADGDQFFNQLAATLGSTDFAVLGGHIVNTNIGDPICTVRTAGPAGAATAYLVNNGNNPSLASAPGNQVLAPASTLNFGFCAPMNATTATPATVAVSGNESGPHSGSFTSTGNLLSFKPTTAFLPGETVFYTLTNGLLSSGGAPLTQAAAGSFTVGGSVPSNGTFAVAGTPATGTDPVGVAVGDFNGDGKLDFATANNISNDVTIMLGNGDGTFAAPVSYALPGTTPTNVSVGDFNGDGKLDLAVPLYNSGAVAILLGNGDGTFAPAVSYALGGPSYSVIVADFNGDGKMDLAASHWGGSNFVVLLGNGDGTFGAATSYPVGNYPVGMAVGDFNGDGKLDLATANDNSNTLSIRLGNGDGSFSAPSIPGYNVGARPYCVSVGDFNGDGKLDLVVADSQSNAISIFLGKGDGTFVTASIPYYLVGQVPLATTVGDFNGDGKADIAVTNESDSTVSILLGKGDGTFSAPVNYGAGSPSAIAAGDFDGDGKLDLVVADNTPGSNATILKGQ